MLSPNDFGRARRRLGDRAKAHRFQPRVELLEVRNLLSTLTYPLTVAEVRDAYGFDQVAANGAGQTIAIVDAYNDPNIFKDVDTFDQSSYALLSTTDTAYNPNTSTDAHLYAQYGASSTFLTVTGVNGKLPANAGNTGWDEEESLDVEWAHAMAPAANIVLVEAASSSNPNLLAAVQYASTYTSTLNGIPVSVVSMSWGESESKSTENTYDSYFNNPGITYVASAGDSPGVEWPAVSPNVVGVGGTSLTTVNRNYTETVWRDSGGGISRYESQPAYQDALTQYSKRTAPDVSYVGNPDTGVEVIDTYSRGATGQYGGTSVGAPQWAALFADANQFAAANPALRPGGGTLSSSDVLTAIYSTQGAITGNSTDFRDATSTSTSGHGRNITVTVTDVGYDLQTGVGSPLANNLIPALAAIQPGSGSTIPADSGSGHGTGAPADSDDGAASFALLDYAGNGPVFTGFVLAAPPTTWQTPVATQIAVAGSAAAVFDIIQLPQLSGHGALSSNSSTHRRTDYQMLDDTTNPWDDNGGL